MFLPFHDDNPTRCAPLVTYVLIAANVLVFVWATYLLPPREQEQLLLRRGFIPKRISQFWDPVPLVIPRDTPVRHPLFFGRVLVMRRAITLPPDRPQIALSVFTSTFMHGGWTHLLFNMWFLWLFGTSVEERLGRVIFPIFYLVGGVLAAAMHWASDPSSIVPVVGASGAVAAILGAYAITWPWARIHILVFLFFFFTIIDIPAIFFLGGWFLLQLYEGQKDAAGGVAWWAHIGGFVVGLIVMPILCDFLGSENGSENGSEKRKENEDETKTE